jgi:hypothetical protein
LIQAAVVILFFLPFLTAAARRYNGGAGNTENQHIYEQSATITGSFF